MHEATLLDEDHARSHIIVISIRERERGGGEITSVGEYAANLFKLGHCFQYN